LELLFMQFSPVSYHFIPLETNSFQRRMKLFSLKTSRKVQHNSCWLFTDMWLKFSWGLCGIILLLRCMQLREPSPWVWPCSYCYSTHGHSSYGTQVYRNEVALRVQLHEYTSLPVWDRSSSKYWFI
jgi:hypothetical protein